MMVLMQAAGAYGSGREVSSERGNIQQKSRS
jgi:hypothetical protein